MTAIDLASLEEFGRLDRKFWHTLRQTFHCARPFVASWRLTRRRLIHIRNP